MSLSEQSFFFTALERDRIAHLPQASTTRASIVSILLYPIWKMVDWCIPETVAPNSITLVGTLSTVQSYYIISQYFGTQPFAATLVAVVLLTVAAVCSAVDGYHAKKHRSGSPLGDIFSKICSSANHIFQMLTLFYVVGLHGDPATEYARWYLLMSLQLLQFLLVLGRLFNMESERRSGKVVGIVAYAVRDSEISIMLSLLMLTQITSPSVAHALREVLVAHAREIYGTLVAVTLASLALFPKVILPLGHKAAVAACLVTRCIPTLILLPLSVSSDLTMVSDATIVSLISVELYVSYFANRRIHAAVMLLCWLSLINALATMVLVTLYVVGMLADLSYSTRIPLFVPIRNVFIDGVYDLCHIGHKKVMEHALQYGNRLVCGVLSDEDCVGYKRRPIMTTEERCREVASCRFVSEVIAGSPCDGLTEEFLTKHNIHVVVCGEEYNKPDDKYYAVPRRLGILKTAPRTDGMSTSILIKRIQAANADDLVAKDKLRGDSVVKDGK